MDDNDELAKMTAELSETVKPELDDLALVNALDGLKGALQARAPFSDPLARFRLERGRAYVRAKLGLGSESEVVDARAAYERAAEALRTQRLDDECGLFAITYMRKEVSNGLIEANRRVSEQALAQRKAVYTSALARFEQQFQNIPINDRPAKISRIRELAVQAHALHAFRNWCDLHYWSAGENAKHVNHIRAGRRRSLVRDDELLRYASMESVG